MVTDAAGNVSTTATKSVTIDATAPTAGTLSLTGFDDTGSNNADGLSNDTSFSLSLSGSEPGSTSVFEVSTDNGVTWAATTASQSGIADGSYLFRAVVTDAAGNVSTTATKSVTIDATAPAAGTLSLTGFDDTGASSSDGLSNDTSFSLSLSGSEPGATSVFEVSTDNGVTWTTTTASQSALADGSYLFRAVVTDAAGNVSTTATKSVTIDATAPAAGTLSLTGFDDTGSNNADGLSNDTSFSLSLSGSEPGATSVFEVSTDNGVTWTTTTASQTGLADGSYLFRAVVTDATGNVSTTATKSVTIDATAPAAGTLSLTGFDDTGASSSDGLTSDSTFGLSVSGEEAGASVSFEVSTDNGVTWTATTASQTGLADGSYLFRAVVTDAAGNVSTTATKSVTIDATAPVAGTLSLTGFDDTGASSSDGLSNDTSFGLSVSGEEAGASVSFEVSTDNGVTWTTTTASQTGLADGSYLFRAVVTDAAGNVSTTATKSVTIDATAPVAGTLSLTGFDDTGASSSDGLTSDSTFGLSVSGEEAGASVSFEVSTDNGTTWTTTTATQSALADGSYLFRAVVTDAAGNVSTTATKSVTIDATAPAAGTLSLTGFDDTGSNNADGLSNDTSFSLSLSGSEPGATSVFEVSTDNGVTWTTTTASQTGLADGSYLFRSVVTDATGNVSTTATKSVTIDATAPAAGTLSLTGFDDTGASSSDGLSNDTSFGLSVSGEEAGASVSFEVSTDNGVTWTATTASQTGLADGSYLFRAVVTDAAGNVSTTATKSVTIDATAPVAGTLSLTGFDDTGASSSDGLTSDSTFGLSVSARKQAHRSASKSRPTTAQRGAPPRRASPLSPMAATCSGRW